MASLNTYNQNNQGFSLLEIIVVVAVIIVILSFGMLVDWNVFKKDTFKAEQATIVAALSKARSRAMNNMFDTAYGVCYIAPNYIIFQDNTCTAGESISANTNIASNPSTVFPPVVFDQLTGNTTGTGTTIHLTDGFKSADIIINNEGTINW